MITIIYASLVVELFVFYNIIENRDSRFELSRGCEFYSIRSQGCKYLAALLLYYSKKRSQLHPRVILIRKSLELPNRNRNFRYNVAEYFINVECARL